VGRPRRTAKAAVKEAPKKTRKKAKRKTRKKRAVRKVAATAGLINLPINSDTDINFWSNLISFLNDKKNKSFIIQLDGEKLSLGSR